MLLLGVGKAVAAGAFSLDWAGNQEDANGGSSGVITYIAVPIGAADANRIIGVGHWWRSTNDTDVITSMTIGGVSASQASGARSTRSDGGFSLTDIWYAAVPTGTTADIIVTLSANAQRSGVSTYRIITTTPTPSNTGFGVSLTGSVTSSSITVPGGGAGFAMYGSRNQGSATTWTNATGDYNANIAANFAEVSSAKFTATNAITASGDGSGGAAISAATWGP